jgi:hypothetical protein
MRKVLIDLVMVTAAYRRAVRERILAPLTHCELSAEDLIR